MRLQVTIDENIYPELAKEMAAIPKNLRSGRMKILATLGLVGGTPEVSEKSPTMTLEDISPEDDNPQAIDDALDRRRSALSGLGKLR